MNNSSLPEWLTKPSKDEMFSLNNPSWWLSEASSSAEYRNYIKLHSKYYFSPLNNIFLFMLKDLSALSFFDKVFVRDGLLSLKLFFLRYPSPLGLKTKLIVHNRFNAFIPEEWCENVYFYDYRLKESRKASRKTLIITYHPDSFHCPDDAFEKSLNDIQNLKDYEGILCLATDPRLTESNGSINQDIYNKAALTQSSLKRRVTPVTLEELSPLIISQSDFLEINPYNYLFADCFIRWYLLYHGSFPLKQIKDMDSGATLHEFDISPQHSLEIKAPVTNKTTFLNGPDEREIFNKDLATSEDSIVNLCSDGYKRYVFNIAQSYATHCR